MKRQRKLRVIGDMKFNSQHPRFIANRWLIQQGHTHFPLTSRFFLERNSKQHRITLLIRFTALSQKIYSAGFAHIEPRTEFDHLIFKQVSILMKRKRAQQLTDGKWGKTNTKGMKCSIQLVPYAVFRVIPEAERSLTNITMAIFHQNHTHRIYYVLS